MDVTQSTLQQAERYVQQGQPQQALLLLEQACQNPQASIRLYINRIRLLQQQDLLEQAGLVLQSALQKAPQHPALLFLAGNQALNQQQWVQALKIYQQALRIEPRMWDAWVNMATVHQNLNQPQEALIALEKARKLQPQIPQIYYNMGNALQSLQRFNEAIVAFQHALQLNPQYAKAAYNLGNVLYTLKQLPQAQAAYQQAITLQPHYPEAYYNLGISLNDAQAYDAAITAYQQAIRQNPSYANPYNNMGTTLECLGRFDDALVHYKKALELNPQHAEAHWNSALVHLMNGAFQTGWAEFEWRFQTLVEFEKRTLSFTPWDGTHDKPLRLLVIAEQGYGDIFQFCRYLPLLKAHGHTLIVEAPQNVHGILNLMPEIDHLIVRDIERVPEVTCDAMVHLMSLPHLFKTTLDTIPALPTLNPLPADLTQKWQAIFDTATRPSTPPLKVGFTWAGNPKNPSSQRRSCTLNDWIPISQMPGVQLFSLQKDVAGLQLQTPPQGLQCVNLSEQIQNFVDTAAIMQHLDLVITVDTSVAHLAGLLGKPVWVLLPFQSDWRWLRNRHDSPWYPSMRLFKQPQAGDWQSVFNTVAKRLQTDYLQAE